MTVEEILIIWALGPLMILAAGFLLDLWREGMSDD